MSDAFDDVLEERETRLKNEPEAPESEPEPEPVTVPRVTRTRRSYSEPVMVRLYHDGNGYHFVGVDSGGNLIKGTESEAGFATVQMAKRGARAAFPTLPIR